MVLPFQRSNRLTNTTDETNTHTTSRRMFAIDDGHSFEPDQAPSRTIVDHIPFVPSTIGRRRFEAIGGMLERDCCSVQNREGMNDLDWTKRTTFGGHPSPKTAKDMWQCQVDGDVWTLRNGPRSIDGCENWIVERYSHGTRTRFATMPSLQSAADVVRRFVFDPQG